MQSYKKLFNKRENRRDIISRSLFFTQFAIGVELRLPTAIMVAFRVGNAMDAMLLDQIGRQDNADGKASDNEQEK